MVMKIMNMQIPAMPGSICPFALMRSSPSPIAVTRRSSMLLEGMKIGHQVVAFLGSHAGSQSRHHGASVEDGVHYAIIIGGCSAVQILLFEDAAERLAVQRLVGAV